MIRALQWLVIGAATVWLMSRRVPPPVITDEEWQKLAEQVDKMSDRKTVFKVGSVTLSAPTYRVTQSEVELSGDTVDEEGNQRPTSGGLQFKVEGPFDLYRFHFTSAMGGDNDRVYQVQHRDGTDVVTSVGKGFFTHMLEFYGPGEVGIPPERIGQLKSAAIDFKGGSVRFNSDIP